MNRKVLLLSQQSNSADLNFNSCKIACEGWLERMGYEVEFLIAEATSTYLESFKDSTYGYEFIVFIRPKSGFVSASPGSVVLNGSATIPTMIVMFMDDSSSTADQVIGVDRTASWSNNYKWVTHKDGFEYPTNVTECKPSSSFIGQWTPITTVQNGNAATEFAQAKRKGTKTTIYFDGSGPVGFNLLSLMQEAINDGLIKSPDYKNAATFDIDDMPSLINIQSDYEDVYQLQDKYSIPITWGVHSEDGPEGIAESPQSVYDWMAQRTPDKGGFIYPIEHQGGTWWDQPYDEIDTFYKDHMQNMKDVGLNVGDDEIEMNSFGYHYFNINALQDSGARVAEKYNFKVIRLSPNVNLGAATTRDGFIGSPGLSGAKLSFHRGMLLTNGSNSLSSLQTNLDKFADVTSFAQHISDDWLIGSAHGNVPYLHGGNFYNGHSGGNAPGLLVLKTVGEYTTYLKDVLEWKHPSALIEVLNRSSDFNVAEKVIARNAKYISAQTGAATSSAFTLQPGESVEIFSAPRLGNDEFIIAEVLGSNGTYNSLGILIDQRFTSNVLRNKEIYPRSFRLSKTATQAAVRVESK